MDIFQMLMTDHRRIRDVLDCLAETGAADVTIRATLYATLREELIRHVQAEQEVLYASLVPHLGENSELLLDGMQQQAELLWTLWELDDIPLGDQAWRAQLQELRLHLEAHIAEEEAMLFEVARERLTGTEARSLGQHARLVKALGEMDFAWVAYGSLEEEDEESTLAPRRALH